MMNLQFTKNLKVKLSSFGIALIFWIIIVTTGDYSHSIDVRLQVTGIPVGKILVNEIPQTAKIRIDGEGKYLFSILFFEDASVHLDLSEVGNDAIIPITPDMVVLPRMSHEMHVQSVIYPSSVHIKLDDLINKKVPVVDQISCQPIDGYTLIGNIKLSPDSVTLSGPKSTLSNIDKVLTEEVNLKGQDSGFNGTVELAQFPDSLRIRTDHKTVLYTGDVQKLLEYTFKEIPIRVLNKPARMEIIPLPSSAAVTAIGGERYLVTLKPENFYLFIDYEKAHNANLGSSQDGVLIQYKTLSDVEIVQIFPPYVMLEKRRKN
ncbi:MAG: hypothetical protein DWQ10_17140 [Calditrichaeota bacterium]|nr:MAG: hypothetical protein DWQ10_17140 [Calditrichota bacterium]